MGRTLDQIGEPPAPSSYLIEDVNELINKFSKERGDVICTHNLEYGAYRACSTERDERTLKGAETGKLIFGTSHFHRDNQFPEKVRDKVEFWYENKCSYCGNRHGNEKNGNWSQYPCTNSGIFAVWWCLKMGYSPVYTIGVDSIWLEFPEHYNRDEALKFVRHIQAGKPPSDFPEIQVKKYRKYAETMQSFEKMRSDFPDVPIYKAGMISGFPVEVRGPLE